LQNVALKREREIHWFCICQERLNWKLKLGINSKNDEFVWPISDSRNSFNKIMKLSLATEYSVGSDKKSLIN
jgi:hypothetical protein